MKNNQRRATLTLGVIGGGLLAASFLPMAVAAADEFDFTPDITSFVPSQVEGYPPLIDEVTGAESWNIADATTNSVPFQGIIQGTDTETTIGSFTNDDYLTTNSVSSTSGTSSFLLPAGSQIDLANFGSGFENEWLDVASGPNSGISDLFITPFGNFELLGSGFSDLSAALTP